MAAIMHIRRCRASALRWVMDLPRRFHRDDDGQLIVMAAVFLLILVMALAVPVQLSLAVRQKIQAQNAADAAAITGAIWQLRGLNVLQGMNDLMYLLDSLALAGLVAGAILGPCTGVPIAGAAAIVAGNIALGAATGSHFAAQCVVLPLRDVVAHGWSLMCYVGASETARENEASPMLGATASYLVGLAAQGVQNQLVANKLPGVGEITQMVGSKDPSKGNFLSNLGAAIASFPVYAMGFEMNLKEASGEMTLESLPRQIGDMFSGGGGVLPMWLHVERVHGDVGEIPLRVEDAMLNGLLCASAPLQPMQQLAQIYFQTVASTVDESLDGFFNKMNENFNAPSLNSAESEANTSGPTSFTDSLGEIVDQEVKGEVMNWLEKLGGLPPDDPGWNHAWYVSASYTVESSSNASIALMPTVTWASVVKDDSIAFRMSAWDRLGGLGVPKADGGYGPLGGMALSAAKLSSDPVRKVRFAGLEGYVMLVPVKITEDDDARSFGICH